MSKLDRRAKDEQSTEKTFYITYKDMTYTAYGVELHTRIQALSRSDARRKFKLKYPVCAFCKCKEIKK